MGKRRPSEGSIWKEKRKDGTTRYRIRATIRRSDGSRTRVSASALSEAAMLERFKARVEAAKNETRASTRDTLRARCEAWLEEKKAFISARTLAGYRKLFESYVYPTLGNRRYTDVKPHELQALLNKLRADGILTTADRVRGALKQMYSHTVRDGLMTVSPMAELRGQKRPKRAKLGDDGSATEPLQIWTPTEVQTFINALDGHRLREMLIVALFTGLRRGEIVALRWEDIGPEESYVHVQRAFDPYCPDNVGPPKTLQSVRKVPLGAIARNAIRIARARTQYETATKQHYTDEGWVFPSERGTMLDVSNYYNRFKTIIAAHNKDAEKKRNAGRDATPLTAIRLHGLRHTYASYLARNGHSPATIQRLLGHATPDLALRVYTHVMADDIALATLELDDVVGPKKTS